MSNFKKILLCLLLISCTFLIYAQQWESIGPGSSDIFTIEWKPNSQNEILATYAYTIFKSADHAQSWDVLYSMNCNNFSMMRITNVKYAPNAENTIYFTAVAPNLDEAENGLYKSTNGGSEFTRILTAPVENFVIHPVSGKILVYNSGLAAIIKMSSNGTDWTSLNNIPSMIEKITFDPVNDNIIYATTNNGLYKTINNGTSWQQIAFNNQSLKICVINPNNPNEIWVGSPFGEDNEFLYRSIDGGANWSLVNLPYHNFIVDHPLDVVFSSQPGKIYVAETNEIFVSSDNGVTWTNTEFDPDNQYFYTRDITINSLNPNEVIMVSDNGALMTQNGGQNWDRFKINFGNIQTIETAKVSDNDYYLYAGSYYGLMRYNSADADWIDYSTPGVLGIEVKSLEVDKTNPLRVFSGIREAHGMGIINLSSDGGETTNQVWSNLPRLSGWISEIISSPSENNVYYSTSWYYDSPGEFIKSTDNGISWEILDDNNEHHFTMTDVVVAHNNPQTVYTFGDGRVVKSTDGGQTFSFMNEGLPNEGVYSATINPYDDNMLIIACNGTYRTTNGAQSWELISPYNIKMLDYNKNYPGLVIAITFDNKAIISYNNGTNWSVIGDFSCILNYICFSPNGQEVFVATNTQGVYKKQIDLSSYIPENLTCSANNFNVSLNWNSEPNAAKYAIYRDGEKIGESSVNSYHDYYLIPGSYNYQVSAIYKGLESALSSSAVINIDYTVLNYNVDLNGSIQNYRNVALNWSEPQIVQTETWLSYGNGVPNGNFSNMIGGNYDIAVKFDPADLADYQGQYLTKIQFKPAIEFNEYSIKVWTGTNAENLLVEQPVLQVLPNQNNIIELNNPVLIPSDTPLWFGFSVMSMGQIAVHDAGPAIAPGKSNLFRSGEVWHTLSESGIDANWILQGCVSTNNNSVAAKKLKKHLRDTHTGYKIYRNGEIIQTITNINTLSFTDMNLAFNTYSYAVTAVYQEGESLPSKEKTIILKDPFIAPDSLIAEITENSEIALSWNPPVFPPNEAVISYSNGTQGQLLDFFIGGNFSAAVRFSAEYLTDYAGMSLNSISFKPVNQFGEYTIKVWSNNGQTCLLSQPVENFTFNQINEFILSTPVLITANMDLWIGFELNHMGGNVLEYDDQPTVLNNFSNLIKTGSGEWSNLQNMEIGGNNIISGKLIEDRLRPNPPTCIGYKIIRDNQDLITINHPDSISYTDYNFVFDVHHVYTVKALYENNEQSVKSDSVIVYVGNPYISPSQLSASVQQNNVTLSWVMISDLLSKKNNACKFINPDNRNITLEGINIYRNNHLLTYLNSSEIREYHDNNLSSGTWLYEVSAVYNNGTESVRSNPVNVNITGNDISEKPVTTLLKGNYPNPFNPETTISFSLNKEEFVSLEIYNIKGQKVKSLVSATLSANNYSIVWNGTDDTNQKVSSGMYFYKMKTQSYSKVNKMLLLK
jgi:photosystem II stability/assembly factor-like uncharacterized protein